MKEKPDILLYFVVSYNLYNGPVILGDLNLLPVVDTSETFYQSSIIVLFLGPSE